MYPVCRKCPGYPPTPLPSLWQGYPPTPLPPSEEDESEEEESAESDESEEGGTGDGQHRGAKRTAEDAQLADADSSEGELGADYNGPGSSPLAMSDT